MTRDPEIRAALYALRVMLDSARELAPTGAPVTLTLGVNTCSDLCNRLDDACTILGVYLPTPDPAEEEHPEHRPLDVQDIVDRDRARKAAGG